MLIVDPKFPPGYSQRIGAAVQVITEKMIDHKVKLPEDLRDKLLGILESGIGPVHAQMVDARSAMLSYDPRRCTPHAPTPPYAYTAGSSIWICERTFAADAAQLPGRLQAVLVHELVHVLCGLELDAECFEHRFFAGEGATPPSPADVAEFAAANMQGRWVVAAPVPGQKVLRVTDCEGTTSDLPVA